MTPISRTLNVMAYIKFDKEENGPMQVKIAGVFLNFKLIFPKRAAILNRSNRKAS